MKEPSGVRVEGTAVLGGCLNVIFSVPLIAFSNSLIIRDQKRFSMFQDRQYQIQSLKNFRCCKSWLFEHKLLVALRLFLCKILFVANAFANFHHWRRNGFVRVNKLIRDGRLDEIFLGCLRSL